MSFGHLGTPRALGNSGTLRALGHSRHLGTLGTRAPDTFGDSEGQCHPSKSLLFLLSFKLGNSILST